MQQRSVLGPEQGAVHVRSTRPRVRAWSGWMDLPASSVARSNRSLSGPVQASRSGCSRMGGMVDERRADVLERRAMTIIPQGVPAAARGASRWLHCFCPLRHAPRLAYCLHFDPRQRRSEPRQYGGDLNRHLFHVAQRDLRNLRRLCGARGRRGDSEPSRSRESRGEDADVAAEAGDASWAVITFPFGIFEHAASTS